MSKPAFLKLIDRVGMARFATKSILTSTAGLLNLHQ
jgi:hypothetical protein